MVKQISAAIVTISDSRTVDNDASGDALYELLTGSAIEVVDRAIIKDERHEIAARLRALSERDEVMLIITTGGTGISPRDVTPEATRDVIDVEIPGIAEAMRRETVGKTITAVVSRGIAGVRNRTLIINLPGSPKGVRECFEVIEPILRHAINQVRGVSDHETPNFLT